MKKLNLAAGLALTAIVMSGSVFAQAQLVELSFTGQPVGVVSNGTPYHVTGYGNARFGMTPEEVQAVIATDFPQSLAAMKDALDPIAATRAIGIVVDNLAPAPGLATITYVFGAASKRLVAVNTYWIATGVATRQQQDQMTAAAKQLTARLLAQDWPFMQVSRGFVVAPGTLVVFAGQDDHGAGVEVRLVGTPFKLEKRRAKKGDVPIAILPPGPAKLLYSVVANVKNPDVAQPAQALR